MFASVSRYRSLRPLGTGPDGVVEEVVPDRLGGERLARRRVPVPAGPRRHRLRETAETLARLGHPGIATVVDIVDNDESGIEVLTTLGADGTLADRAASGPMATDDLRALLVAVADALGAAHGAGVAHGHLTAANVLLRDGRPLLADFGLAEARTGRPHAHPFRADVRDLATLGSDLLDPADPSPSGPALRTLLHWVADDPDATLADLRRGLAGPPAPVPPPPPPTPPIEAPDQPRADGWRAPLVLVGTAALALGLLAGSAAVLAPALGRQEPDELVARSVPCETVAGPLRADVDGDGCDEPVEWRAAEAEVAYPDPDGALLRFRVGRPGDDLVLGDWDCDGTATAAVVRPATGETFVFDAWAASGETLVASPGPTLPSGATPAVVDDGGCDRIRPARA